MMIKIKNIIFDLGNVIFSCSFRHAFQYWSKAACDFTQDYSVVFDAQHVLFEKGLISTEDFFNSVNSKLNKKLSFDDFITGWNSIYESTIPGIDDLLSVLKGKYKLLALTNTNEIHFKIWNEKYKNTLTFFNKIYSSNIIKMRKPDDEAYQFILKENKINPEETLFLDDAKENVDSAAGNGINSILVSSFDLMKRDLMLMLGDSSLKMLKKKHTKRLNNV